MTRLFRYLAIPLALCALMAPARAAYPTPAEAGFHHCALIYGRSTRSAEDLAPYVAYDKQPAWLFDAFLFLLLKSERGIATEGGETQKVDWEYHLDRWFAPGRDLAALDDAIEAASKRLGPPPAKRRVMLSIPYVNPAVHDFGEIDGHPVSLARAAGREAALRWYLGEAIRRFRAAHYRHLELWGFYPVRESIDAAVLPTVRAASDLVHGLGYRVLWIPYAGADGVTRWKDAGIDVAIYQPNYAFNTWQNGGGAGRNRLAITAETARANGMGVEIEGNAISSRPADRRAFLHYLADGAPARFGYQSAATAYYLSTDMVEITSRSSKPAVRAMYDALARYVRNQPVADPDPPIRWKWTTVRGIRTAEARFARPRPAAALETSFDEPSAPGWAGMLEISVLRPGGKGWTPGAWGIRSGRTEYDGRRQWTLTPIGGEVTGIRVAFRTLPGAPAPRITGLAIDPNGPTGIVPHAALNRPYAFTPAPPAQYPDNGRRLVDGATRGGCWSGVTVGWQDSARSVAVCFDLGREMPVSEARAYGQGGGADAVAWPDGPVALFSAGGAPPATAAGLGAPPRGFAIVRGGPVVVEHRRAPNDEDGYIPFRPAKPIRARYVTLLLRSRQWLMLSEVRTTVNGRNVAPQSSYSLAPPPAGGTGTRAAYRDNGVRLTDGVVADEFTPGEVTGWHDDAPRTVTVDLGAARPVREVVAWTLKGGMHGIYAPKSVVVDASPDGKMWTSVGRVEPREIEDKSACVPLACRARASQPIRARFVRVRAERSHDWAMLSEVEVR